MDGALLDGSWVRLFVVHKHQLQSRLTPHRRLLFIYSFGGPDHRFSLTEVPIGSTWGKNEKDRFYSYVGRELTILVVGTIRKLTVSTDAACHLCVELDMLREKDTIAFQDLLYLACVPSSTYQQPSFLVPSHGAVALDDTFRAYAPYDEYPHVRLPLDVAGVSLTTY